VAATDIDFGAHGRWRSECGPSGNYSASGWIQAGHL